MSKSLNPDQNRHSNQGPNCLQEYKQTTKVTASRKKSHNVLINKDIPTVKSLHVCTTF